MIAEGLVSDVRSGRGLTTRSITGSSYSRRVRLVCEVQPVCGGEAPMAKLIYSAITSLDGYVADEVG